MPLFINVIPRVMMEDENEDILISNYLQCHQMRAKKPQNVMNGEETFLHLNNLPRGRSEDKNDRETINIATRSISKICL